MPTNAELKRDPVDLHVGRSICERRKALGLTQSELASAIGVTFQQVQKYEKGTNRVSASMLHRCAEVLGCDVAWFFPPTLSAGEPVVPDTVLRLYENLPAEDRRTILSLTRALAWRGL